MSHPHEWDDPRMQAEYAARHRYEHMPYGAMQGVDPRYYHSQTAYYEAQQAAYAADLYWQEDMTLLASGRFPYGADIITGSWTPTDIKRTPEEENREKAKKSVYQQARNLAANIEEQAQNDELYSWSRPEPKPWYTVLRHLELAIEAYEDGDETEEELKERLDRYVVELDLSDVALLPPYVRPAPVRSASESSTPTPTIDEPSNESNPVLWRRFLNWLRE